jgi:hypothetical protein
MAPSFTDAYANHQLPSEELESDLESRPCDADQSSAKLRVGGIAIFAVVGTLLALASLVSRSGYQGLRSRVSLREFLEDSELSRLLGSNAAAWSSSSGAPAGDAPAVVRDLIDTTAAKAPEMSQAMEDVSLGPEERQQTLELLRRLGDGRAVSAGKALHQALDPSSIDGQSDALSKLSANVRAAMRPHTETIRGLRAVLRPGDASVHGETVPERLRAWKAVAARMRNGAPLRRKNVRAGDDDPASLIRDQLMVVLDVHATKIGDALKRLSSSSNVKVAGRRLVFDNVYTICADPTEDANGCDLCPVTDGEMPTGCKADQPTSCACTYGAFANAPKGQIPKDPQQGPTGCDPNCEMTSSFMKCFSGDASTRAGEGGMPVTECMGQMATGYGVTPVKNLMNDVSDPFFGDHDHSQESVQ